MIPILWALGMAIVAAAGGAYVGWDYRDGKVAQQLSQAQHQAIVDHNEDAASDMMLSYKQGLKDAASRSAGEQLRGEADVANKGKPFSAVCALDPERRRVLSAAISLANGDTIKPAEQK